MSVFRFKQFEIRQERSAMKVGTDALVLGALMSKNQKGSGLDIGSGTGVLSLMMAQLNPEMHVTAIEKDQEAYRESCQNAENSMYQERIKVLHEDLLDWNPGEKFDLIVSNPPFYEAGYASGEQRRDLARQDVHLPPEVLIDKIAKLLSDSGSAFLIYPHTQNDRIVSCIKSEKLILNQRTIIYGKVDVPGRVVFKFSRILEAQEDKELVVRDEFGQYTEAYILLTRDFHATDLRSQLKKRKN
ncbi:MAG: methyltransferase domain-containing protein [Bacteroidetes bacterium]|nr:MAG: methyltransferase domain-containing protein [Bacteroidota bacterium]